MTGPTARRRAEVIADEWLTLASGHHVAPGYMLSSDGDDAPPVGTEARAAFKRHSDMLPKGARIVEQVTIKGYPATFYDMPKRSFLARLADSVRGRK